jgi:hypothetical protein
MCKNVMYFENTLLIAAVVNEGHFNEFQIFCYSFSVVMSKQDVIHNCP